MINLKLGIPEKLYHLFHNQRFLKQNLKSKEREVYDKDLKNGGRLRILISDLILELYKTDENGIYKEIIKLDRSNINYDEIYKLIK